MPRKIIRDFPCYSVDETGAIYREGKNIPLAQSKTKKGYLTVNLSIDGKASRRMVHRIVLEAFVGIRPSGMHGCHLDGDKSNNALLNLAWMTPAENESHKSNHGTLAIGEKNGASKLTKEQVEEILRLKSTGRRHWGAKKLAKEFGVDISTIVRAGMGMHWSHVGASK